MTREIQVRKAAEVQSPGGGAVAVTEAWYQVIEQNAEPAPSLRTPIVAGVVAIVLGFGGFLGWAYSASLDSAAVAVGSVIVDLKRKTVSHLEGGILDRLLVQEGEVVKVGQPLVRLDNTRARTELYQLQGQNVGLRAALARLRAEQTGATEVVFPDEVLTSKSVIAPEVIAAEKRLFANCKETHEGRIGVQKKTIEQHVAEADALAAQISANARQKELIGEQRDSIKTLVDKGYAKRSQLIELEARWSEFVGKEGELAANKAKAEQAKASAEIEILSIETDRQSQIGAELQKAQLDLNTVLERMENAQDVLRRVELTSPQEGIVANIQMRTRGAVVPPGQPIMDIVPENEPLVIEAKIGPRDIDSVRNNANVRVRLTAYNDKVVAPLPGHVTYVAADQTIDQSNNSAYFIVRAEIDPAAIKAASNLTLHPGMPAELLVLNRPRKAIDYLISPITESFNRAFREE